MGETTTIAWCDHTFNPWVGCSKVAPGCAHCYAEADMDKRRHFAEWGPNGTRVKTSEGNWKKPYKWNHEAQLAEVRAKVFCASLADVFEDWDKVVRERSGKIVQSVDGLTSIRRDLFSLIDDTAHLDWLLLTKRPENIRKMWPGCNYTTVADFRLQSFRDNVWLGTSVSDQETANKAIPELLTCSDLSPVLFLSVEPLLGPINLRRWLRDAIECENCGKSPKAVTLRIDDNTVQEFCEKCHRRDPDASSTISGDDPQIDWVIVGGESGPNARTCRPEWIRSIVKQCHAAGIPCFVKQLGANVVTRNDMVESEFNSLETGWPDPDVEDHIHGFLENHQGADCRIRLRDKKGGDPTEWPEDLRVREFPSSSK